MRADKQTGYNILCLGLFLCIIYSMQIWIAKIGNLFINNIPYLFLFISIFYTNLWDVRAKKIFLSLLFLIAWILTRDYETDIFQIRSTLPIILVILLKTDYYDKLLQSLTKMFAIILLPAIILHLLIMIIPLPPIGGLFYDPLYGYYYNYIFNIHSLSVYSDRFNACFCEPGHLGMIMSFILYVNEYNIKKWPVLVCLTALILAFSLAGYVLAFIGWIIFAFSKKSVGKVIKFLLGVLLSTAVIYNIAINYNNGKNYLNEKIISRLQYDEEKGISGNNRTTLYTDSYFEDAKQTDLFWGLRSSKTMENFEIQGAGYKIFIIEFGLSSVIVTFILYFIITQAAPTNRRKYCYGLLVLYIIAFIQRAYPYWAAWLVPYMCFCFKRYKIVDYDKAKKAIMKC